jgi:Ca2+-binding EF-hand superfamily protein
VDEQVAKDGFITADELSKWIEHTQKRFVNSDSEKMHEYNDVDKDGAVTWDEYVKVTYTDDKEGDPKQKEESKARDEPRFKLADKNGDKKLDKDEFNAFLHPEHHEHMKPLIVKETIHDVDKDKDGFISYEEYMNDMWPVDQRPKNGSEPDWVKTTQKQFHEKRDANKDGKLDDAEVKAWVLPDVDEHVDLEAKHLIKEADADKDGKITKEEMLEKWDVFVGSNKHGQTSFSDIINSERDEL